MIFTAEAQRRGENKLSAEQAISGQRSAISLNRAPRAHRTPKGTRSTDLRCVVFLGSPYGAPAHRKALGKRPAGVADMDVRDQTPRQDVAWVRRGPQSRGCAGDFAPSGVSFLLVTLLWISKEEYPWVGGGSIPHSNTRG